MSSDPSRDVPAREAVDALAEQGITRVCVETPDLNGGLRGKHVSLEKLRGGKPVAFPEAYLGFAVDDELIDVPLAAEGTGYPDLLVAPDWETVRPAGPGSVAVLGDGLRADGRRHPAHPRSVLRSVVERAEAAGYVGMFGVEYEFWAFRSDGADDAARRAGDVAGMAPLSFTGQGYSLVRWGDHAEFVAELDAAAQAAGLPIETVMTEIGNGMLEVALAPATALRAADGAARFKVLARDVARRHGLFVTFMAKLIPGEQGSSGHLHQSLLRDGTNAFWGGGDGTLSDVGLQYTAGLLRATRDCTAFFAPLPNSYRRFVPGMFAPLDVTWGWDDRTSAVRAITLSPSSARLEQRRGGADMHPYLAIAACLAGGLDGIERGADPGPPVTPVPGATFPADLDEAAAVLRDSAFARDWLGDELVDLYAASREAEARAYRELLHTHIPAWEVRRYFEVI